MMNLQPGQGLGYSPPHLLAAGLGIALSGLPAGSRLFAFVATNLPAADYSVFEDAALTVPATVYNADGDVLAQPINASGGVSFYATVATVYVVSAVSGGTAIPVDPPENVAFLDDLDPPTEASYA